MHIQQFECVLYARVYTSYSRRWVWRLRWLFPQNWRLCTCILQNPGSRLAESLNHLTAAAWTGGPGQSHSLRPEILRRQNGQNKKSSSKFSLCTRACVQYVCVCGGGATFPPGDGRFWRSVRLAGKKSCIPISYCLVRRGGCKCGGHTWNKKPTWEDMKEMATTKTLVRKDWKRVS